MSQPTNDDLIKAFAQIMKVNATPIDEVHTPRFKPAYMAHPKPKRRELTDREQYEQDEMNAIREGMGL